MFVWLKLERVYSIR